MKYHLINSELNTKRNELPLSHIILENRQIYDAKTYLNLTDGYIVNYRHLCNIENAKECLLKHIEQGNKIGILTDTDVDGYASASMLYQYLSKNYDKSKLEYYIHTGKQHGLSDDIHIPNSIKLLIIPDAGTNDADQCRKLQERGIETIIVDHHLQETENPYAIIVNNQIGPYPNRSLSGCGVTKKFLDILDDEWWADSSEFDDLVAVSIIADSMSLKEYENKRLVEKGLSKIQNKLLLALIEKQAYSMNGKININNFAFYIVPLVNALIRTGTYEDKNLLFRAFIETDETFPYKKRGEDIEVQEDIYTRVARIATNLKAKQGREVDKALELLHERITKNKLDQNKILFCWADEVDWSYTGLAAMKLANEYNRPCLLLRKTKDDIYSGSARNFSSAIKDLKGYLGTIGLFESLQGHSGAFGASIKKENIKLAIDKINEDLKDVDTDYVYEVDFEIDADELTADFIKEMSEMQDHYGQGVEESFICVKNIKIDSGQVELIGKDNDTWKCTLANGCVVIKFKVDKENDEVVKFCKEHSDDWGDEETICFDAVGKCSINSFNGKTTYQFIASDFEVR